MKKIILGFFGFASICSFGQLGKGGNVTGNIESNVQVLNTDTLIGATAPDQRVVANSYMNVNYSVGKFRAGARFESYSPSIAGYPAFYSGSGMPYKYLQYAGDQISVTVGNFYEQFGSGLIFRSYEERALGLDNAMEGASIRFSPLKGVDLKGIIGRQRVNFFEGERFLSDGLVRGVDGSLNLNEIIPGFSDSKFKISLAGSLVSRYQATNNDTLVLPKNVGAYGGRIDMRYSRFYLNAEFIHKDNDPNEQNNWVYNSGHGALINMGYSQKGLGIILTAKSLDNMTFRSDRNTIGNQAFINYLPATSNNHTYNLAGTLYPYATNLNGEVAYQLDVFYKIPKKTTLGGKYGTDIHLNVSVANDLDRDTEGANWQKNRISYLSKPFGMTDSIFNFDFNLHASRKFNKKWKASAHYFHFIYNNTVNEVTKLAKGYITSDIGVVDVTYKINRKHSIRAELQALFTKTDRGDWATAVIEYTISPKWFFTVIDQFNFGHPDERLRIHYLLGAFGYTHNNSRFMFMYGKQREGILCVGGVCRPVPATNGLTFTFTQAF